jgi:hypothetical protein
MLIRDLPTTDKKYTAMSLTFCSHRQFLARPLALILALAALSACDSYRQDPNCSTFFSENNLGRFILQEDGAALDADTGLLWYRCAAGMRYSNGQCLGVPVLLPWDEANQFAADFGENSSRRWRLPGNEDVRSITETQCRNPAVNTTIFPQLPVENFWTNDNAFLGNDRKCMVYSYRGQIVCREQPEALHAFMLVSDPD